MRRKWPYCAVTVGLLLVLAAASTTAVTYVSKKKFIQSNFPEGAKLSKATVKLTAEDMNVLKDKWAWKGPLEEFSFIIAKDTEGKKLNAACFLTVYATEHNCVHHVGVALNADGSVKEVAIMELFCERAMPVAAKSFLGQFSKKKPSMLKLNEDISAVTGATESSKEVTNAANMVVAVYSQFLK